MGLPRINNIKLNGQDFDKMYHSKDELARQNKVTRYIVEKLIRDGEILEFTIRTKNVYIIRDEFIDFLQS